MRILVTGGSGFLGQWVVSALVEAGHEVYACGRNPPRSVGASTLQLDMLEPAAAARAIGWSRPDTVLHLAWYVEHGKFWQAPDNLDWVAASLRLAAAAAKMNVRRFVGVGTCMEYDIGAGSGALHEFDETRPTSLYAVSKDAVRRLLQAYCQANGIEFAWGRPFFTFGPHEQPDRLVASIATSLLSNRPALISSGLQVRDFLDVQSVGAALAALAVSRVTGAVNLASGQGVTIAALAEGIWSALGGIGELRIGALPDRPNEPPRIVADVTRLREEVGFRPPLSLQAQLQRTADWWRQYLAERART